MAEFIDFMSNYESSKELYDDLTPENNQILNLSDIFHDDNYRTKIPEPCRKALERLKSVRENTKKLIDQFEEKMDLEKSKYKKELN